VIIGYGGNDGDCENFGPYHGWIVAIPETGGAMRTYEVDAAAGESEGAVWMGGGSPLVDSSGNIWFATGNGSRTSQPYDFSDSVTELSSAVQRKQYFAPNEWGNDNATDADLGSAAPAFVNGYVFQAGKSLNGYLLNPSHLGGIGGDLAHQQVCGNDPHGGEAVVGSTVYVGCGDGVTSVTVHAGNPPTISVNWAAANGANGPPIYASGLVWTVDGNGNLSGLDPTHGNVVVSETTNGGEDNHFPTPTVADGLMLVPTSNQVFAYDGPAGLPPSPGLPHGATRYWVATATGGVYAIGGAPALGSLHQPLHRPIVGMASTPDGRGYWLVASDGGVFAFGDAHFFGSMGGRHLNRPIVGIAGTSDGRGYWMVASDGGIFTFGDARFHGSMGGTRLAKPVVGMASQPHGPGYWLVASDGGIFAFGGAHFDGSTGGMHLVTTITGMAANPGADGGYWLVGADGGVFAFGARYQGSLGGTPPTSPVVSIASTPDGVGYWLAQRDGTVDAFGDAVPEGGAPPGASSTVAVNGSGTA
jgi:hypothetical protein